jgi:hypothetical protein
MTSPPPDVDDLRSTLRSLGYLDAGLDRFVLAPVRQGRGAASIAFRSSLRIGLLVAGLLGPAAAIGVALRLPGLITGPQDAIVIAAYLAALFGAAAAAGSFAAALLAGMMTRNLGRTAGFSRRARAAASIAGFVAGLLCLAYLTLWWRATEAGAGGHSPAWTLFALAVAAAISLLIGHAVGTTAVAVIATAAGAHSLAERHTRRSWRFSALLGFIAFIGSSALLLSIAPAESLVRPRANDGSADLVVVPTGVRMTLVAIDGFDAGLYRRVASAEATPYLHTYTTGAVATLPAGSDQDPARVWTSIATGRPPDAHGIESLETRKVSGVQGSVAPEQSTMMAAVAAATDLLRLSRPSLASDAERREKTLWEVAAEKGFRTAVVNWWATWPAPIEPGVVVTDRAVLRLERGGELDAEIAPPSLYPALKSAWASSRADATDQAQRAFAGLPADIASVLVRSAELDALLVDIAIHPSVGETDLLAVYLPGLDIAQYALLGSSERIELSPSALAERVEALQRYYPYLDSLLGKLAGKLGQDRLMAVVTHPGRVTSGGESLFVVHGPRAANGARLSARLSDVMPTLLYALGIPVSRELAGSPIVGMLDPAFGKEYAVRTTESYGRRVSRHAERGQSTLDEEMIERLRSLGYVGGPSR